MCSYCSYSGNVLEVIANLTWSEKFGNHNALGIVGIVHPDVLYTLRSTSFPLPVVSLIHFGGLPYISSTYYMTVSTSTLVESILTLASAIGSNSIGVIAEEGNTFYHRLSTELVSKLKHHPNLTITLPSSVHNGNGNHVISDVIAADARVLFLSMSPHPSSRILCKAYK